MFRDYIGKNGLIQGFSYLGNAIIKFDDGTRLSTLPSNISLIHRSEVKPMKTRKRKKPKEDDIDTKKDFYIR